MPGKLWGGTGELHVMGAGTGIVGWVWGTILYRMAFVSCNRKIESLDMQ